MPAVHLNSSAIRSLDYDPKTKRLVVQFTNGKSSEYPGIDAEMYEAFKSSDSPGRFFHQNIKQ